MDDRRHRRVNPATTEFINGELNEPAPGHQFYMLAMEATYNGPESADFDSEFVVEAVGASQVIHDGIAECGYWRLAEPEFDPPGGTGVYAGGTLSGNAECWNVTPSDAASLVMSIRHVDFLEDADPVWFALHR